MMIPGRISFKIRQPRVFRSCFVVVFVVAVLCFFLGSACSKKSRVKYIDYRQMITRSAWIPSKMTGVFAPIAVKGGGPSLTFNDDGSLVYKYMGAADSVFTQGHWSVDENLVFTLSLTGTLDAVMPLQTLTLNSALITDKGADSLSLTAKTLIK